MTATMFEFEYGRAHIRLPVDVIVQNFFDSMQRAPVELPALITTSADTPPAIGAYWHVEGGFYAGMMRGEKNADYHLIVAADASGLCRDVKYGSSGKSIDGAASDSDGYSNTSALAKSDHSHPAAEWAAGLNFNGYADWYLPARRELRLCWVNVPELFEDGWYWSSTQYSAYDAWFQYFDDGYQGGNAKASKLRARAVRRLSVIR